ncbi:MAG: GH25 family lysozyme [Polyangiales bacterium]
MSRARRRGAMALLLMLGCGGPTRRPQPPRFAIVCGRGPTVEGVDVSEYQGEVDWSAVRASGRRFAIARIAHAPRVDARFEGHWRGIREAGMIRGAYLYFSPAHDVAAQADAIARAVGRLGPGDLPVALDIEKPPPGLPSPADYAARIAELVSRVTQSTGRAPMIYTGAYYWRLRVRSDAFKSLPLGHPQYAPVRCPSIAPPWSEWTFWQYSNTGRVPGVRGDVDLDRFNGDLAALERLAGGPAPTPDAGAPDAISLDALPAPPSAPAAPRPRPSPAPSTP